jgi:hypothetical protein
MAASAGTNPGSTPDGVADGVGVGDGDSLAEGVGDGDALGEGDVLAVAVGADLTADPEVHPTRTTAVAITPQAWTIRRDWVPPPMYIGRGRRLRACTTGKFAEKLLPYAQGICQTLTAKTRVRFGSRLAACFAGGEKKPSGR